ncbi:hypothetical protein [Agreia sp. COWG]|uniref:hypothetical protein n=1 Tax=Agreia sp. COWG TaxID=2773266 RepID=UPI0019253E5E|nr:hypothetical protein [Agreia sp. COWG]CAD6001703.1 conserved protein of unknown function [Agreia sp. COWG]
MSIDADSTADGLEILFEGSDGLAADDSEMAPAWSSSPWTLAGLVVIGCLAVTALIGVVLPVAADLVLGWLPRFFEL